jgi:predicted Fe-Mo cluster-binding NifX family protein
MKLCFPTTGEKGLSESVHNHFGSAKYFTIYNTETNSVTVVKNGNEHHQHGQCNPLSQIAQYNIDAVLTNGMGRGAVQKLNAGGVKVYLVKGNTVAKAIANFESSDSQELTMQNACGGHEHSKRKSQNYLRN